MKILTYDSRPPIIVPILSNKNLNVINGDIINGNGISIYDQAYYSNVELPARGGYPDTESGDRRLYPIILLQKHTTLIRHMRVPNPIIEYNKLIQMAPLHII